MLLQTNMLCSMFWKSILNDLSNAAEAYLLTAYLKTWLELTQVNWNSPTISALSYL